MRSYKYYEIVQRGNFRYRSLNRIAEPSVEPVSLSELKSHLRIDQDFTDDDMYLQNLISAARGYVETVCDRTLVLTQWRMCMDVFPPWDIELPRPPIAPGDVVVTYIPSDNIYNPVPYTNFRVDRDSTPAAIRPQWNLFWPSARGAENDVVVTWFAGYGDSGVKVPPAARHSMLMLCGHWFVNREAVAPGSMNTVPMAVDAMLGSISWGNYR